jgi:hypothetical protein
MGTSYLENLGWRYCVYCYGGFSAVLFIARFIFDVFESPYYLLKNDQTEAVRIIRAIATKNKTKTWLTEDILNEIGGDEEAVEAVKPGVVATIRHSFASLGEKLGPLFSTRKQTKNTVSTSRHCIKPSRLMHIRVSFGSAGPVSEWDTHYSTPSYRSSYQMAKTRVSKSVSLRRTATTPSSVQRQFRAAYLHALSRIVEGAKFPWPQQQWSPVFSSSALASPRTANTSSRFHAWHHFSKTLCLESSSKFAYGCSREFVVLTEPSSYTPETFPGYCRGTGTGIAHSIGRVAGLIAPILAANMSASNGIPYVSAGLILAAFLAMLFLKEIKEEEREITGNDVVAQV